MNVFDRLEATLDFSDEERMLIDSVRLLARENIMPSAERYDRSGEFPWDNIKAIN